MTTFQYKYEVPMSNNERSRDALGEANKAMRADWNHY
jgi:hypothetical protein